MTELNVKNDVKPNKSLTYLLPLLASEVNIDFYHLLMNCYIKFNIPIAIDYPIGLLFNLEESKDFEIYNNYLINHSLYHISYIILPNSKLYIFKFPDKYINDYKLFKEGKYSKLSAEAKKTILIYSAETYKYAPLIEDITGVLWKHKSRKLKLETSLGIHLPDEAELTSKINENDETFKFK